MIKLSNTNRMQTVDGDFTLFGVFQAYQQEIAANWIWCDQTLIQYRGHLVNTIIPCIDDHNTRPIGLYTPEYMDEVLKRIDALGYQRNAKAYKPETMNRFRHIMAVTVRTAITHMLCPDVWKQNSSFGIQSKTKVSKAVKPVRYFSPKDDLRIIQYITENANKSGEMRGLYIMMCTRCRENEAAGLTWEMIRDNEDNPQLLTISIIQTTQLTSAKTKLGGKTVNAPRQITLTPDQSAFIRALRDRLEEQWVRKGGALSDFRKSRVATQKNKLRTVCRARHLSDAANTMFAALNLTDKMSVVNMSLAKKAIEYAENPDFWETPPETSATCYSLRRAAATFDRVLGIDLQDRQYLMGHAVSNVTHAHIFRDGQHQCALAGKSADRPGLNTIYRPITMLDGTLMLQGTYQDTVLASCGKGRIVGMIWTEEPGDQLHFKVSATVPCKLTVKTSAQDPPDKYSWEVNVKRKLHEMYDIKAVEGEG